MPSARRLPHGLVRHESSSLTTEQAMAIYERDQVLWVRLSPAEREACAAFDPCTLRERFAEHPSFYSNHWSVENPVAHKKAALTPAAVLGPDAERLPAGPFYISSILQQNADAMAEFVSRVPFAEPPLLEAEHDDGVWLFYGVNPAAAGSGRRAAKRPRRAAAAPAPAKSSGGAGAAPITGRPEHTDAVTHSGTWHVQLQGTKTWHIRPLVDADTWAGKPPSLAKHGAKGSDGQRRLKVATAEGDLLLVNTRIWWHRTEIEAQESTGGLSISYARDFCLPGVERPEPLAGGEENESKTNVDGLYASRSVAAGEVVMREEEMPDCELVRSTEPNCRVEWEGGSGEEDEEGGGCLVALRPIEAGEFLTVEVSDDEDEYEEYYLDPVTGQMTLASDE